MRPGKSSHSIRSAHPTKTRSTFNVASSHSARSPIRDEEGVPETRKRGNKLQNLDGSVLTVKDYQKIAYNLQHGGSTIEIANFGFQNTQLDTLLKKENKEKVCKKKDYMGEIEQQRRLLPQYAREERLRREQRLKELGFWTKA